MARTKQKGISLSPEMWKQIREVSSKKNTTDSRYIELNMIPALKRDLGKEFDKNCATTRSQIGRIADKVGATKFAGHAVESFKEDERNLREAYKLGWCSEKTMQFEIDRLNKLYRSSFLKQATQDKTEDYSAKAVNMYKRTGDLSKALKWLDSKFTKDYNKTNARERFKSLLKS